jgi:hypothetical protein
VKIETEGKVSLTLYDATCSDPGVLSDSISLRFQETTRASGEPTGATVTVFLPVAEAARLLPGLRTAVREHIERARAAVAGVTPEMEAAAAATPSTETERQARVDELGLALSAPLLKGYARDRLQNELAALEQGPRPDDLAAEAQAQAAADAFDAEQEEAEAEAAADPWGARPSETGLALERTRDLYAEG